MNDIPELDAPPPDDELVTLRQRVEALERADRVVRCRRLVVVDDAGAERIVLESTPSSASVRVLADSRAGRSTAAEIYAVDAQDADPATVGVALTHRGDVVALIELGADGHARWWRAGAGDADWEP